MFKTDFEKAREMILEKQGKDKQKEVEDTLLLNKLEKVLQQAHPKSSKPSPPRIKPTGPSGKRS
ncbi:MAG: hypothetical protein R2857_00485 [Vampirovibrionales bacterium]